MSTISRLYFKLFKHYRRVELRYTTYLQAERLLATNAGASEREQWRLAKEEDYNHVPGLVALERVERILE